MARKIVENSDRDAIFVVLRRGQRTTYKEFLRVLQRVKLRWRINSIGRIEARIKSLGSVTSHSPLEAVCEFLTGMSYPGVNGNETLNMGFSIARDIEAATENEEEHNLRIREDLLKATKLMKRKKKST